MTAVAELVRPEREALIADLRTLSPEQWATPSLCAGWTVQDVAAHLAWASAMSPGEAVRELVSARFRLNVLIARTAPRWALRGPDAIVDQLGRDADEDAKPLGMPWDAALIDAVVHGLDIRRPLGLERRLPAETFRRAADFAAGVRWPASAFLGGGAARVSGLRLVAEDQAWSTGSGPEVRASGDAVLLVLTGRPVDAAELSGPGAATLADRVAARPG